MTEPDNRPSCTSERKGMTCAKRQHDVEAHVGIDHDGTVVWWRRSPVPAPERVAPSLVPALVVQQSPQTYTGESCPTCGSLEMVQRGYCGLCLNCGSSGGCG